MTKISKELLDQIVERDLGGIGQALGANVNALQNHVAQLAASFCHTSALFTGEYPCLRYTGNNTFTTYDKEGTPLARYGVVLLDIITGE